MRRRSKSAYNFFTAEKKKEIQEANPGMGFKEITRKIAEMWKALSDEEKKPYNALAEEDKACIAKEIAENPIERHQFITRRMERSSSSGSDSADEDYK